MVTVKYMGTFDYVPSFGAAIVFAGLFGLSTVFHLFQLVRFRVWFFIPFLMGGVFEVVGYVASMLILLAPALFAASVYMELGRIMIVTDGEKYSIVRRSWLTKIFVLGDVVSFLAQVGGAGIGAGGDADS